MASNARVGWMATVTLVNGGRECEKEGAVVNQERSMEHWRALANTCPWSLAKDAHMTSSLKTLDMMEPQGHEGTPPSGIVRCRMMEQIRA